MLSEIQDSAHLARYFQNYIKIYNNQVKNERVCIRKNSVVDRAVASASQVKWVSSFQVKNFFVSSLILSDTATGKIYHETGKAFHDVTRSVPYSRSCDCFRRKFKQRHVLSFILSRWHKLFHEEPHYKVIRYQSKFAPSTKKQKRA